MGTGPAVAEMGVGSRPARRSARRSIRAMPVELQIAVAVVAILGFGVSLFLAALRFEERRAKPDLYLDMDWTVGGGDFSTLRIVAGNRGKATGGVRHIVFSPTEQHDRATGFEFMPHFEVLPVRLDPGDFTHLPVSLMPKGESAFTRHLLSGQFKYAILVDGSSARTAFRSLTSPLTSRIGSAAWGGSPRNSGPSPFTIRRYSPRPDSRRIRPPGSLR